MADDLMDFGESASDEKFVDDQDENDGIPFAPGLVQSPVIVNSILKQSTKDNLIQLYTPIQKPEKGRLKVHFGADSLLQTPNVKTGKKKTGDARGIKFTDIAESPAKNDPRNTEESAESVTCVNAIVNEILDKIPVPSEENKGDNSQTENGDGKQVGEITTPSNADESAMDISVCDAPPSNVSEDPDYDRTDDILKQAELLLKSLRGDDTEEVTAEPTETKTEKEVVCKTEVSNVERTVDENDAKPADVESTRDNVDGQFLGAITLNKEVQDVLSVGENVEEAMDCEEAMEVDDEIVFNLPKGIKNADINHQGDENNQKLPIDDLPLKNVENNQPTVTSEEREKSESNASSVVECENSQVTIAEHNEDLLSSSLNGLVHSEIPDCETAKDVDEEKKNVDEQLAKANDTNALESSDTNEKHVEVNTGETFPITQKNSSDQKGSSKTGEDTSDDEFMSADEDMEVDVIKTPLKLVSDVSNVEQNVEKKEDSPERIPPKVGYNLNFDDLEAMDPFSTKKSIMNSPDFAKQNKKPSPIVVKSPVSESKLKEKSETEKSSKAESTEKTVPVPESPKPCHTPKLGILMSPNAAVVDKVCRDKNAGNIFDEKLECLLDDEVMDNANADMPLKGTSLDFTAYTEADMESIDPFKPKQQICNTPDKIKQAENDLENKESEISCKSNNKDNSSDAAEKLEEEAASKTVTSTEDQSKVPLVNETNEVKVNDNTELPVVEVTEVTEDSLPIAVTTLDKEDAPEEVPKSPAIPISRGVYNLDDLDLDAIDPFKCNKQMANSPCSKTAKSELEDPFESKNQIMNSPVAKTECKTDYKIDSLPVKEPEAADKSVTDIDKVVDVSQESKDKLEQLNGYDQAPSEQLNVNDQVLPEQLNVNDQVLPEQLKVNDQVLPEHLNVNDQVLVNDKSDSIQSKNTSSENSTKEVQSKDSDEKTEKEEKSTEEAVVKEKVLNTHSEPTGSIPVDPFADLNPFKPNQKVANTPEKVQVKLDEIDVNLDEINPFATKSMVGNSPDTKDNPFVTKSCVANSPVKDEKSLKDNEAIQKTPPQGFSIGMDDSNDIFEVQGVTRRGEENLAQMDQFGDVDDTQFVSASQVFNDPGVWEMLENIGTTSNTAESALSRMSLYVKFDPLVDAAPINPRRVSIRFSQLEKVKEYGVDDTLLLLGTPPSKRRQSMSAKAAPFGSRTTPATSLFGKDAEPANSQPDAVDLIFAYSPKDKEQKEEKSANHKDDIAMCLMEEAAMSEENENLFQELKYTDADLKKIRMEMKLALQGTLMNKEQEWCQKFKQLENEKAKVIQKLDAVKKEGAELKTVYLFLEQTVGEIIAERDAAKRKIEEIKSERDQALEDIQSIENAFSILNGRYDKSKSMIQTMMKNDEIVKKYAADLKEKLKQQDEKYHALEKTSKQKNAENSQETEKLKHQVESMQEKFNAQLKLMQMKNESLEKRIQSKTEENQQLTEICDNLLSKCGQTDN